MLFDEITGVIHDNEVIDIWYVPKQFYRLVLVKMWKNKYDTAGFEVVYRRPNVAQYDGWPLYLNHTFGETDIDLDYEEVELEKEIETLTICVDNLNQNERERDFEGFEFT